MCVLLVQAEPLAGLELWTSLVDIAQSPPGCRIESLTLAGYWDEGQNRSAKSVLVLWGSQYHGVQCGSQGLAQHRNLGFSGLDQPIKLCQCHCGTGHLTSDLLMQSALILIGHS